jgi:PRC-barrel domain protein
MDKRHLLSLVAAIGLVGATAAQAQSTPTPEQQLPPASSSSSSTSSDPSAASSPHQRDATGTSTAPSTESPATEQSTDPSAASSPHQQETVRTADAAGMGANDGGDGEIVGLEVISPAGNSLGTVVAAVQGPSGAPAYVVIASPKGNTAVPYPTAASMVHDNAVVIDQSKLNGAPKVQQDAWKDNSNSSKSWRTEADRYWSKSGMGSKDSKSTRKERG